MAASSIDTSPARHVVRGACPLDCPDTCSWEVAIEGGRAVELRGTKDHPFTRGSLCAKVDRYLDYLYAPDRLLYPMRRMGPKGAGQFMRISWDDALSEMAGRLGSIVATYGGEAVWPYAGCGSMGYLQGIAGVGQRVWNRLGASVHVPNICSMAGTVGTTYTMGSGHGLDPEAFRHAKLILLWGSNLLATANHGWRFIAEARRGGARVIVIDPVRTRTSSRADEHLAPIPGTDAVLALGLLHVIVGMGAEDRTFIEQHTLGWEAFRKRILDYPPDRVARITGVSEQRVIELGRRIATTRPTAIRTSMGMQRHAGGGTAVRTIMAIPAVTGDWQYVGGGAVYSTSAYATSALNVARFARTDVRPPNTRRLFMTRLGEGLLEATDPRVMALIVCGANPVASNPDQNRVRRALAREDLFTVVIDHFQTDTADYADLVLPTTAQPEHADLHHAYGHLYLTWNEPAVRPPGECLPSTEIFRRLARHLGLTEPWLYESDDDLARALLDSDHPAVKGITLESLKEAGWARLNYSTAGRAYPQGYPTPSSKIEFYSQAAENAGLDPLAGYVAPAEVTKEQLTKRYPLALISSASLYFLNSMFANIAWHRDKTRPPRIVLHPADAFSRGISTGQPVRVFNDRGEFEAEAEVSDAVQPGVAMTPKGYWPKLSCGRATVNATVEERDADMGRGAVYHDNRVDVQPLPTGSLVPGAAS